MGKQTKNAVVAAQSSGIVIGSGGGRFRVGARMRVVLLCVLVAIVVGGAAGGYWAYHAHNQHVQAQRTAAQHTLQKNIADANALGNPQKLQQDSTNLIDGAANGKYDVSNADLAAAYSNRAYVELNDGKYQPALDDFRKAEQLDPSSKANSQSGEFMARYHLGERKTLIPLLQEIEKPLKNSQETGAAQQLIKYDGYISDLQAGKDLDI